MNKAQRMAIFLQQMCEAPCCDNVELAYNLLCRTLNEVEDQYSGVPYNSDAWADDGRLYPPQPDRMKLLPGGLRRYRSLRHYTYIAPNGAIRICQAGREQTVLLDKPGADGVHITPPSPTQGE